MTELKKISLKKHKNILYMISLLFSIARALPHAVLTIYLINKGISIQNILLFQISFMLPIFVLEIPSGIISDKISRKLTYIISLISIIAGFSMIGFGGSIPLIFAGQFFYGVATALMSGTIEASMIYRIKDEVEDEKEEYAQIKKFATNSSLFTTIGVLIGGVSGSFIYFVTKEYFYLTSISIFLLVFILTIFLVPGDKEYRGEVANIREQIKDMRKISKKIVKKNHVFLILISVMAMQFFLQPFFNWWPKISTDVSIDKKYLSLIYGGIQVSMLISIFVFKKVRNINKMLRLILLLSFISLLAIPLIIFNALWAVVVMLPLALIPVNIISQSYSVDLQSLMHKNHISTQTSLISTISRIASMIALIFAFIISHLFGIELSLFICGAFMVFIMIIFELMRKEETNG